MTPTARAAEINAEVARLKGLADVINADPIARQLAEGLNDPTKLKNFSGSELTAYADKVRGGTLTPNQFNVDAGVRTLASRLAGAGNVVTLGLTVGLILAIATDRANASDGTIQDSLAEMGLSLSEQTLRDIGGQIAVDALASIALGPIGWAKKLYELYQSGDDIAGIIDLAATWKPEYQALQTLNSTVHELRDWLSGFVPDFTQTPSGPPPVSPDAAEFRDKVLSDFQSSVAHIRPDSAFSEADIPALLKAGNLIRTGALAENIAGDFLNGVSKGTVSPFKQADIDLANAAAAHLPPGGVAEFLGSPAGGRLLPSELDAKTAATWDITKTIQQALRSTQGGLPEDLGDEIRSLAARLSASGNAVAALPLLGKNFQSQAEVWDAVRTSLSILDAGRNLKANSTPPTDAGAIAARNQMVANGTPLDIANQAASKAQQELSRQAGQSFNAIQMKLDSTVGRNGKVVIPDTGVIPGTVLDYGPVSIYAPEYGYGPDLRPRGGAARGEHRARRDVRRHRRACRLERQRERGGVRAEAGGREGGVMAMSVSRRQALPAVFSISS